MKDKITWLAVLQGWSMFLVVLGHVDLNNEVFDPNHPLANWIHTMIYGFHMPLFMFISVYLFYMTRIKKKWKYGDVLVDKLKRLYIPMIFFTCFTFLAKVIFSSFMKHPAELSWSCFFDTFLFYRINPLGEMWFVISLLVIMLLYPIYRLADSKISYEMGLLFFLLL